MTLAASAQSHRRVLGAVLALYVVALVLVLGWPTRVDAGIDGTLMRALGWLHGLGMPTWLGYAQVEFTANVALFVPVGLLLALELRRRQWWIAALTGFGISVLAELAQALLRPDRIASALDVLANTAGTVIGVGVAALVARRAASRSEAEQHDRTEQLVAVEHTTGADLTEVRAEQGRPIGG